MTVNCHGCGAPIVWADHHGVRLPLNSEEAMIGPHRYVVTQYTQPYWQVDAAAESVVVSGHIDHRTVCPARR